MKKNFALGIACLFLSTYSFSYVLIGEGTVSNPIITGTRGSGVVEKALTGEQQAETQINAESLARDTSSGTVTVNK